MRAVRTYATLAASAPIRPPSSGQSLPPGRRIDKLIALSFRNGRIGKLPFVARGPHGPEGVHQAGARPPRSHDRRCPGLVPRGPRVEVRCTQTPERTPTLATRLYHATP